MFFRNISLCSCLGVAYLLILYVTELRLSLTLTKCFNGHLRHVSWMIHAMVIYTTFPEWFTLCHLRHVSWMIHAMVIYTTFTEWFTLCHLHHVPWMIYAMVIYTTFPEWFTLWSSTPRSLNDSRYGHLHHVPWMIHAMVIYATFPEWFTLWSSTPRSWMNDGYYAMDNIYVIFPR